MKLLTVDPHREDGGWIQDLQRDATYHVMTVGNGEEALEMIRHHAFHAVLINSILPDMIGTELATCIKEQLPDSSIFIIAREASIASMELWMECVRVKSQLLPLPLDKEKLRFILNTAHVEIATTSEEIEYEEEKVVEIERVNVVDEVENQEDMEEPDIGDEVEVEPVLSPPKDYRIQRFSDNKGKVVVTFSWKGGIGKTTTSANLATVIQTYSDKSVALVELTRQTGNVLSHFELLPSVTIRDWIEGKVHPKDVERKMLIDPTTGLYILPTQTLIAEIDNPLRITVKDALQMVQTLREVFDVVIVDAGTIIDSVLFALLKVADHMLLLSNMTIETLQENHYMPEILKRRNINPEYLVHVINMVQKGMGVTTKEAISMVGAPVTHTIHYQKQMQMQRKKKGREPFVVSYPRSPYTDDLCQLANFLFPDIEELQVKDTWIKRMVKKLSG